MEFGDSGSMAAKNNWQNAITVDLPVEATVISRQGTDWILHIERENSQKDQRAYFRLSPESENIGADKRELQLRDKVTVLEAEHVNLSEKVAASVKYNYEPHRHILSYSVVNDEQEPHYNELVAVAAVTEYFVLVVGSSFTMNRPGVFYRKPDDVEVTVGQFVMVNCYPCDPGVRLQTHCHPISGCNYYIYIQSFQKPQGNENILYFPGEMRPLEEEEKEFVGKRLRTKENVTEDEALIYIRDPHIAVYALECYLDVNAANGVTLRGRQLEGINLQARSERVLFKFLLTEDEFYNCIQSDNQYNWRTCTDLTIQHENLYNGTNQRMEPAYVRYLTARILPNNQFEVELIAEQRSDDLMTMIKKHSSLYEKGEWTIGPLCYQSENIINSIKNGFNEFFHRRETFEQYAGWKERTEDAEIPDKDKPFYVKNAPLDPHQLAFMKSAAHHPGWTCAQAPPGCGKTHTTSALVSYLNSLKVKGGVCISGTTNAAVTNAADAVKENFPEINIIRNYSNKAEYDITEKSGAISLKQMAKNCDQHLEGDEYEPVFEARQHHEKSVKSYNNKDFEKLSAHANAYGKMKNAERQLNNQFIRHYQMNVYATTVELLIRGGDKFASGVVRDSEDYSDKAIQRIILDEAAQLSPSEALALYCSLPELTHITLLGDSYQLGPHCRLEKGSDVYNFKTEGELTRMYQLPSTIKKSLNGLYRCHPQISEKILIPIYGNMMEPRVSAEERNMASRLKMPMAKDGSPVMMFHVQGKEEKCSNVEEATTIFKLLIDLITLYGAAPEDIVILVFHRQQKIKMMDLFSRGKKNRDFRPNEIRIETVDSFQGKEAKIVILSTVKSCIGEDRAESKLQFIADPQRATVAMSRAQHAFYLVGDLILLARSHFYAKIMDTLIPVDGFKDRILMKLREEDQLQIRRALNKTLIVERKAQEKKDKEERREKREQEKKERKERREMKKAKAAAEAATVLPHDAPLPDDDEVLEATLHDSQGDELAVLQAQLAKMGVLEVQEPNLTVNELREGNAIVPSTEMALDVDEQNGNSVSEQEMNGNGAVEEVSTPEKENVQSPAMRRAARKPRQSRLAANFLGLDHSVCPVISAASSSKKEDQPLIEF